MSNEEYKMSEAGIGTTDDKDNRRVGAGVLQKYSRQLFSGIGQIKEDRGQCKLANRGSECRAM